MLSTFGLHTISSNSNSLLFKAYLEQIYSSCEKSPLLNFVKEALKEIGFSHVWKNHGSFDHSSLLYSIRNKLNDYYISFWENSLKSENGKLRTYKLFKYTFGMEMYLDMITDKSTRKHLSSFRISAHRLHIERGRCTRPRTSVEDRLCSVCKEIEDEFHFMFECEKYRVHRNNLFEIIKESNIILSDCNREILLSYYKLQI